MSWWTAPCLNGRNHYSLSNHWKHGSRVTSSNPSSYTDRFFFFIFERQETLNSFHIHRHASLIGPLQGNLWHYIPLCLINMDSLSDMSDSTLSHASFIGKGTVSLPFYVWWSEERLFQSATSSIITRSTILPLPPNPPISDANRFQLTPFTWYAHMSCTYHSFDQAAGAGQESGVTV